MTATSTAQIIDKIDEVTNKPKSPVSSLPKPLTTISDENFQPIAARYTEFMGEKLDPEAMQDMGRILTYVSIKQFFNKGTDLYSMAPVLRFAIEGDIYTADDLFKEVQHKTNNRALIKYIHQYNEVVKSDFFKGRFKAATGVVKAAIAHKEKGA